MNVLPGFTERKYVALRRRLDELGYHQPLSFDALILVEKLLNDLLHTTERLAYYKDLSQKTHQDYGSLKDGIQPFLTENEKLSQECNFLRSKLLTQIDEAYNSKQKLKTQLHSVKSENSDLQFLNFEYIEKIRKLEKEISERNHRILKLQNENLQAMIVTFGSTKETKQKRQPKLEIEHPLCLNKKWKEHYFSAVSQVKDPYLANMMSIADNKIVSLSEELEKLKIQRDDHQEEIKTLRNKVISQEKEIYHLKTMEEGTCCMKHHDAKESQQRLNKNLFTPQMAEDITFLEKNNKDLKRQIKDSLAKQHEAMEQAMKLADRNRELEKELHDIDHVALAFEAECKSSLKENTERVSKIQDKLESSLVRIHDLEQEILELKHRNADLKKQVEERGRQRKGSEDYVERMLQEKKREMEQLNQNVEHLTKKTDQLSHTIHSQKRRIMELESKLLENASSWKSDKNSQKRNQFLRRESNHGDHYDHGDEREQVMPTASSFPHETLQEKTAELDVLRNDVHRLEEELSALRELQKVERECHEEEKKSYEKSLLHLEEQLHKLKSERKELSSGHGSLRSTIHRHENTISKLEESLKKAQSDYQQEKNLNSQLKTLQEQTERALLDAQSRVTQMEAELTGLQERWKGSESSRSKTGREADAQKKELINLRESLMLLDQEKDNMMIKIDEKTERIAALEEELNVKNSRISHLENSITDMKKKIDVTFDDNVIRSHETRNLQQEIDRLRQELAVAKTQRENAMRENRRIQDDLASVTNDCRISHRELEESRREVEDLKIQLQGYVDEVRRIEELMTKKEDERNDLLDQFRSLSAEASVLESTNHSLESETTDARIQLRLSNERIVDLERQLDDSHSLIRSYENQITELTRQVATLEVHLRLLDEQRERLETDLKSSREMSAKLDDQKSQIMQRLNNKDIDKKMVEQEVSELRKEVEKLHSSMAIDKEAIASLESRLTNKGKESLEHQMINDKLKMEIEKLKGDIKDLERKMEREMAEVHKFKDKKLEFASLVEERRTEFPNSCVKVSFRSKTSPLLAFTQSSLHALNCLSKYSSQSFKNNERGYCNNLINVPQKAAQVRKSGSSYLATYKGQNHLSSLDQRWNSFIPLGSDVSSAVDEKEDEDDVLKVHSPTNSYFSG